MISKEKLDFAAKQVVTVCLSAKKGEKACVITDNETKHIGFAITDAFKMAGCLVDTFIMEDFGERPEDGENPLQFPKKIADTLRICTVSVFVAGRKKNERQSFRRQMLNIIEGSDKLRHAHMIAVNDKIMETGMAVDYKKISQVTHKVSECLAGVKEIKVSTAKGTNLIAKFHPDWKWVIFDGFIKKSWSNLPDGEIFTCPKSLDGKVVVDGVLGDHLATKYGMIEKNPVYLEIENGFITSASCNNKKLEKELIEYIGRYENANRIGEFAIGTNVGLKELVGVMVQDEKFPGVHIAAGDTHASHTGANWKCETHLDMVIQKTTIEVDGKVIMKDGKFLI